MRPLIKTRGRDDSPLVAKGFFERGFFCGIFASCVECARPKCLTLLDPTRQKSLLGCLHRALALLLERRRRASAASRCLQAQRYRRTRLPQFRCGMPQGTVGRASTPGQSERRRRCPLALVYPGRLAEPRYLGRDRDAHGRPDLTRFQVFLPPVRADSSSTSQLCDWLRFWTRLITHDLIARGKHTMISLNLEHLNP